LVLREVECNKRIFQAASLLIHNFEANFRPSLAHVILEEAPAATRGPNFVTKKDLVEVAPSKHINGAQISNGVHKSNSNGEMGTVNDLERTNHDSNDGRGMNGIQTNCIISKLNGIHHSNDMYTSGITAARVPTPQLIILTAKAASSLHAMGDRLVKWASSRDGGDYLPDLSFTLATRRTLWNYRSSFVVTTHEELVHALTEKALSITRTRMNAPVVFMFTGQGAQWYAMGRELIQTQSAFGDSFTKSDKILKSFGAEWSLVEELLKDEISTRIGESEIAQPASTAIQIALVDLLVSWGICPEAVVGHSSGEIAAAYAAGALTHVAALEISYHRGFLSEAIKQISNSKGAMMAVGLGEAEVTGFIDQITSGLCCVACINSPGSTTISGDEAAIDELKGLLDDQSIFNRKLKVDTAYHSHHMKKVADRYVLL
jgi:acyl transferase domain-containing protein